MALTTLLLGWRGGLGLVVLAAVAFFGFLHFRDTALVTEFHVHQLILTPAPPSPDDQGLDIYIQVDASVRRQVVAPGVFDREISTPPYWHYFTLTANVDRIETFSLVFESDRGRMIRSPITARDLNQSKGAPVGVTRFHVGPVELPFEEGDFEKPGTLDARASLTGTRDGAPWSVQQSFTYERNHRTLLGNRLWHAIMSV